MVVLTGCLFKTLNFETLASRTGSGDAAGDGVASTVASASYR